MRVVERPGRIEAGGKGFRIFDPEAEVAEASTALRVRHTVDFALCEEPEQRMLLAVAGVADAYGIASGWDETSGTARGVGVSVLALKAGMGRGVAERALDRLCKYGILLRLTAKHPPYGPVWVLPDYED